MVDDSRPTEDRDIAYIERQFGVRPLAEFLTEPGTIGVVRFIVMPAFEGESVHTLLYRADEVAIDSRCAERPSWHSLLGAAWTAPKEETVTRPLDSLPPMICTWGLLKKAAIAAPSVEVAIIDGSAYVTFDGIGYRHRLLDAETNLSAEWFNPTKRASNHVEQVALVKAYNDLLGLFDTFEA